MSTSQSAAPSPLLIAQLDPPHAGREGDWYYRTYAPGLAMAAQPGVFVINLDNVHRRKAEILRHADVLILNSVVDADLLPILRERREARLLTVYEVSDDVSAVPPENPVHAFYQVGENLHLFLRLAHACDANQFSVPELQRRFGYLCPRGRVLLNQIAELPPPRPLGPAGPHGSAAGPLTIGWGGSRGHLADMAAVAGPLCAFIAAHPDVRLRIMGAEPIWRLFDALPADRKEWTRPGSLHDYYAFVAGLDIGLAPLMDHGFNRSRSDVKFLEYAAHGVVPVVQALVPYLDTVRQEETGFLFSTPAQLIQTLTRLAADPPLRHRVAGAAYRYVAACRREDEHAAARLSFYREALAAHSHQGRSEAACRSFVGSLARWPGARQRGQHVLLESTRYEQLLHDGLVLSQHGRQKEAVALFLEAGHLEPTNYQPYLCLAAAGHAPLDTLAEALRRNPRSIQSWLLLGGHLWQGGAPGKAIERFLTAAELYPSYELPYLRTAQVLRHMGDPYEAQRLEKTAEKLLRPLLGPSAQ
jgi:hypothetical protein